MRNIKKLTITSPDFLIPASEWSDAAPRLLIRLTVPRCRLSTYGCRAFYHASPTVWNWLPTCQMNLEITTVLMALNDS